MFKSLDSTINLSYKKLVIIKRAITTKKNEAALFKKIKIKH